MKEMTQRRGSGRAGMEDKMLNNIGLPGLILIAVVFLVLFGKGKVSSLMGEVGKGVTAFKKGIQDGQGGEDAKQVEDKEKDKA